jgi:hypothetical protein
LVNKNAEKRCFSALRRNRGAFGRLDCQPQRVDASFQRHSELMIRIDDSTTQVRKHRPQGIRINLEFRAMDIERSFDLSRYGK